MTEINRVTSAVQKALDVIDDEINKLYDDIYELRKVKKYISKNAKDYYTVASRTGGSDHHVGRYADGTWYCNCEASKHELECWALKGLRIANPSGGSGAGWFYDDKGYRRDYTWSGVEWPAPFRTEIRFY